MSNTTPQQAIPEWFQKWIDEDCRANCTTILEGKAVWSIGHEAGAIAAYSRLSSPVGLRWLPITDGNFPKDTEFFVRRTDNKAKSAVEAHGVRLVDGWDNLWGYTTDSDIEYLSESPLPIEQEGELVKFLDWFLLNYMNSKGATKNSSKIVVENYLKIANLPSLPTTK